LLTEEEDSIFANRFNIDLLSQRLIAVTQHMLSRRMFENTKIGYFGASTGAASALSAAASLPDKVNAVVSRGGRPDLACHLLPYVKSPTLLLVGSEDEQVITLNLRALRLLKCEKKIVVIEGAGHLFEEPGKLDEVAELAKNWYQQHFHPSPGFLGIKQTQRV
jgi:pimeloyl-ACP methyl ester carboxylesterase